MAQILIMLGVLVVTCIVIYSFFGWIGGPIVGGIALAFFLFR